MPELKCYNVYAVNYKQASIVPSEVRCALHPPVVARCVEAGMHEYTAFNAFA